MRRVFGENGSCHVNFEPYMWVPLAAGSVPGTCLRMRTCHVNESRFANYICTIMKATNV